MYKPPIGSPRRRMASAMARNWIVVLSLPSMLGAITAPSEAITPRSPMRTSSRPMISATIHGETRLTPSSAISTRETSSLSAVVSRKEPSLLVTFQRRASRPSIQSVAAAAQNSAAASGSASSSASRISAITTGVRAILVAVPTASTRADFSPPRVTFGIATGEPMLPAQGGFHGGNATGRHAQRTHAGLCELQRYLGVAGELPADPDGPARRDHARDQVQQRWQRPAEQGREPRVAAFGRHRVLREVVRADAEEVDVELRGA